MMIDQGPLPHREAMADSALAEAILDRILHYCHWVGQDLLKSRSCTLPAGARRSLHPSRVPSTSSLLLITTVPLASEHRFTEPVSALSITQPDDFAGPHIGIRCVQPSGRNPFK